MKWNVHHLQTYNEKQRWSFKNELIAWVQRNSASNHFNSFLQNIIHRTENDFSKMKVALAQGGTNSKSRFGDFWVLWPHPVTWGKTIEHQTNALWLGGIPNHYSLHTNPRLWGATAPLKHELDTLTLMVYTLCCRLRLKVLHYYTGIILGVEKYIEIQYIGLWAAKKQVRVREGRWRLQCWWHSRLHVIFS